MKKIIALFLTAAVLWSLAACGKNHAQTTAGTQPIKDDKASTDTADHTPANTEKPTQSDPRNPGKADAETFAALTVRYFKEEGSDVKTDFSSDGKTVSFYYGSTGTRIMYAVLEDANDISKGTAIHVDEVLARSLIEQGKAISGIVLMMPCGAAYLSLTEGKNVTVREVNQRIADNMDWDDYLTTSTVKYSYSALAVTLVNKSIFMLCKAI